MPGDSSEFGEEVLRGDLNRRLRAGVCRELGAGRQATEETVKLSSMLSKTLERGGDQRRNEQGFGHGRTIVPPSSSRRKGVRRGPGGGDAIAPVMAPGVR